MAVERIVGGSSLVEVLDRVLDKGIVVDAWLRVSLVGLEVVTVEARVVIASVDTYLRYAEAIAGTSPVARPKAIEAPARYEELAAAGTRKTAILLDEQRAGEVARPKRRKAVAVEPSIA